MAKELLSEHMERVQGPASYWIDDVKQLEAENERLKNDNEFLAKTTARAARKSAQVDGLLGYACVIESMLHKQGVKLPPRPSLMNDIYRRDENTGNNEIALGVE